MAGLQRCIVVTSLMAVALACSVTPDIPTHGPSHGELNYCVASVRGGTLDEAITTCSDCLFEDPDAALCHLGLSIAMLQMAAVAPRAEVASDLRAKALCHLEACAQEEPRCRALHVRVGEDFPGLAQPPGEYCGHRHPDFFAPLDMCMTEVAPTIEVRNECRRRRERMERKDLR